MAEVAAILRERLGEDAAKVPKRSVPNFVVRAMGLFDPSVRSVAGQLGKRTRALEREGEGPARLVAPPERGHDRRLRPQPAQRR